MNDATEVTDAPGFLVLQREVTVNRWVYGAIFVALLLIGVSRSPYLLLHGRFYAEEGALHFSHMVAHPGIGSLLYVQTRTGYWNLFCDLATFAASKAALADAPIVTVWISFAVVAAVVWSALRWPSELLPTATSRIAAAVLLTVGTMATPEAWLNSIVEHAYIGIFTVLLLFVDVKRLSRARLVFGAGMLVLGGLSAIYTCALAPLFCVRAFQERSRRRIAYAVVVSGAALGQLAVVINSRSQGKLASNKMEFPRIGSLLRDITGTHFTTFLFGSSESAHLYRKGFTFGGLTLLVLLAAVIFLFLLVLLAYAPNTRVAALLVGAFVLEEMLVNYGALGGARGRYIVMPIAILTLMLVHGAAVSEQRVLARIATVMCGVVLVAGLSNFWTTKPSLYRCINCPQWSAEVQLWKAGKINAIPIWPYPNLGWSVLLPQHLRSSAPTLSPSTRRFF